MKEEYLIQKEALQKNYKDRLPLNNPFILRVEGNKEMFVLSGGEGCYLFDLDVISQYRVLYDTVLDNASKIELSFDLALENALCDDVQKDFNPFKAGSENEWLSYYYIENALFRIETLWDILAQFYNIHYSLNLDPEKVYHSRIFSNKSNYVKEYWKNQVPQDVQKVIDYFLEEDNDESKDDFWRGNYSFTNDLRNKMTHRVLISDSAMSSYAFDLKHHPSYLLKRLTETYYELAKFIYEICEKILLEANSK